MTLSEAMDALAKLIATFPEDLDVEATVWAKIHDDVPPLFVEESNQSVSSEFTGYTRVVETRDGLVKKSIRLEIHD